ncbi:TetR/AcrR family transcriptional regulator C-terminal domain-containing protein [Humibacillus xanthopallidus]|uniref:TetR/AcrR family transcriptional regulator C-terminal domain-containing protein n=1 Tax=Humibacillus xanthopallidus TaxID=412689 RepID=UPI0038506E31
MTPQSTNPSPAPPADRPKRSRRGTLSRDEVLAAAVRLVDADGLDGLTMRRLGQELGRDPMALYRYTRNREALLDGVAEHVLDQLDIPTEGSEWQVELRRIAHDVRALAMAHPHVVPLLVTRPPMTPLGLRPLGTLRPLERILELLTNAGFPPADALHVYRTYFGFLFGSLLNELQEVSHDPEESEALLRLGLHRLPADEFPLLRGLASELVRFDGAAELDLGLEALLIGLQARLDGHVHRQ